MRPPGFVLQMSGGRIALRSPILLVKTLATKIKREGYHHLRRQPHNPGLQPRPQRGPA